MITLQFHLQPQSEYLAFKGQNITFTVDVLLTRILYSVTPGPAVIRELFARSIYWVHIFPCSEMMWSLYEIIHICTVCEYSRLILITIASCHICAPTCSFGDAVALLRESYRPACLEKFSCFLQLSDRAYVPGARCIDLFLLWSFKSHRIQI